MQSKCRPVKLDFVLDNCGGIKRHEISHIHVLQKMLLDLLSHCSTSCLFLKWEKILRLSKKWLLLSSPHSQINNITKMNKDFQCNLSATCAESCILKAHWQKISILNCMAAYTVTWVFYKITLDNYWSIFHLIRRSVNSESGHCGWHILTHFLIHWINFYLLI